MASALLGSISGAELTPENGIPTNTNSATPRPTAAGPIIAMVPATAEETEKMSNASVAHVSRC